MNLPTASKKLPLHVQFVIENTRSFAVFFAALYGVISLFVIVLIVNNPSNAAAAAYLVYYLLMSGLNILCAKNLRSDEEDVPLGWVRFAAILGLPTIFSIIGIFINIALWGNVRKASKYEREGAQAFDTDEAWLKKNKKPASMKRQTIAAALFGGGLAIMLGVALLAVAHLNSSIVSSDDRVAIVRDSVAEVKAEMNLPYEVDDITTLNDVVAEGTTIEYYYTVHDADTSSFTNELLADSVRPGLCTAGSATKTLLDNDITFAYYYVVKETGQTYSFTVAAQDCV